MSNSGRLALLAAAAAGMSAIVSPPNAFMMASAQHFGEGGTPARRFREGATVRPRHAAEKRKEKRKAQRLARRTNRTKTKWR